MNDDTARDRADDPTDARQAAGADAANERGIALENVRSWFDDDVDFTLPGCVHYRPFLTSCLPPIAVGDLVVVEQQLCGYGHGEIAQIENVMARERREHSSRDLNRVTDTTETTVTKETEESTAMKVDERFSLAAQAQEAQSQQSTIGGNFSASYRAPAFSGTIGGNASYSSSKSSSRTTSQEYAKNITNEASQRVKQSVSEVKRVTVVTESTTTALRGFDNSQSESHIQGIYQWVNKRYKAQLFDYGKRLFLQFLIPEPAFYLRDVNNLIDREELTGIEPPVHPRDRRTAISSHRDISEGNYAALAAEYEVTDLAPPPPRKVVKGKSIAHPDADTGTVESHSDDHKEPMLARKIDSIVIDPGYHLVRYQSNIPQVEVNRPDRNGSNPDAKYGYYSTIGFSDTSHDVNILLVNVMDTTCYYVTHNDSADDDKFVMVATDRFDEWHATNLALEGEIPITVGAEFEGRFYFNFLYEMERNPETYEQWQIETYEKVLQGYSTKLREYQQKLREAELARDTQISALELKPREETYREIEATELRKHCIDVLTRHTAFAEIPAKLNKTSSGAMEINLGDIFGIANWQAVNVNGATTVFFEDSLAWSDMTYSFYPYFWTDKERWPQLFREADTGDAQFDQFLKAGYAKVLVPIRPSYERSVLFFLKTRMIWAGGEVPAFSDDTTLSLLEELHESVQLQKGEGMPVGEPWEITLPTPFVYLREDSLLPDFDCAFAAPGGTQPELPNEDEVDELDGELQRLVEQPG